jgi:hypothetical protein
MKRVEQRTPPHDEPKRKDNTEPTIRRTLAPAVNQIPPARKRCYGQLLGTRWIALSF